MASSSSPSSSSSCTINAALDLNEDSSSIPAEEQIDDTTPLPVSSPNTIPATAPVNNFRKRRLSLPRHHHLAATDGDEQEEQGQQELPFITAPPPPPPPPLPEAMATLANAAAAAAEEAPAQFLPSEQAAAAAAVYGYGDAAPSLASWHNEDEKAHTFRKRRLSLTQTASHLNTDDDDDDEDDDEDDDDEQHDDDDEEDDASSPLHYKRPRRRRSSMSSNLSEVDNDNTATNDTTTTQHMTRIAHSAELLGGHEPPPSPAVHAESILYQKGTTLPAPNSNSNTDNNHQHAPNSHYYYLAPPSLDESNHNNNNNNNIDDHHPYVNNNNINSWLLQPKWKRRLHWTDETKLPFSKSIVGTFSCHGVEPIYNEEESSSSHFYYNDQQEQNQNDQQNHHPVEQACDDDDDDDDDDDIDDAWKPPPTKYHPNRNGEKPAATEPTVAEQQQLPPVVVAATVKPTMVAKINQDRGGIAFPYGNSQQSALFAVYDGHGPGGELVSQYCLHEIQRRLERHHQFHVNIHVALTETFIAVDADLRREPLIEPNYAGTTACVALLRDGELFLANSGDSRGVLGRRRKRRTRRRIRNSSSDDNNMEGDNKNTANGNDNVVDHDDHDDDDNDDDDAWDAIDLTVDQNPDSPGEKERILSMGGYISPSPGPGLSARVWLDPQWSQIGLAMGRSIGDHAVSSVGVICTPVITQHLIDLNAGDEFMILASDGVWEFITSQMAVDIVGQHLKLRNCATRACQALIEAAAARWHDEEGEYRDDITAIVVRFPELLQQQQQQQQQSPPTPTTTSPNNCKNGTKDAVTKG